MAATQQLKLVISAKNDASNVLSKINNDIGKFSNNYKTKMESVKRVAKQVSLAFIAIGAAAVVMGKKSIDASIKMENSIIGLSTVSRAFGQDQEKAKEAAMSLASDGLLSVAEASEGLKNLLGAGFNLKEATKLMDGFKDSASFNRQGMLSFGESIIGATQGIKNQNSIMVDNAGITKNLSIILKEAGYSIQDLGGITTDTNIRMALYNGLLKEMAIFEGDTERASETLGGKISKLKTKIFNLQVTIGNALAPAVIEVIAELEKFIKTISDSGGLERAVKKLSEAVINSIKWMRENKETIGTVAHAFYLLMKAVVTVAKAISSVIKVLSKVLEAVFYSWFRATDKAGNSFKYLRDVVSGVVNSIKNSIKDMSEYISRKIENVLEIISKLKEKMSGLGKKMSGGLGDIFGFRQFGGAVQSGNPVVVGEHRPEVFVPSQSGNIKQLDQAGGREVNINFNNVSITKDADIDILIDKIKRAFDRDASLGMLGVK